MFISISEMLRKTTSQVSLEGAREHWTEEGTEIKALPRVKVKRSEGHCLKGDISYVTESSYNPPFYFS